jgi:tetratricopeptide (TPR) repeat protein
LFGALGITGALLVVLFSGALVALPDDSAPAPRAQTAAPATKPRQKPARVARRARARGAGWLAKPVGIATSITLAVLSATELVASHAGRQARDAYANAGSQSDPARQNLWLFAAQQAQRAAMWAPFDDGPLRQEADAIVALAPGSMQTRDLLRAAEQNARRAIALQPLRAINYLSLGNALAARAAGGEPALAAAAESAFAQGARLAPVDAVLLMGWARAELQLGRPQRALESLERVTTLYPREAMGHALAAAAYVALDDRPRAKAALERAAAGEWRGNDAERRRVEALTRALGSAPDSALAPRGATR